MSYSTGVNLNPPSEFTLENLREKPIITDPSKQTSATFDYILADAFWYNVEGTPGKQVSIYVDTSKNIGNLEVPKEEFKHIKKQFQIIESVVDPVTGNAFDIKVTKNEELANQTDIKIFSVKNIRKIYGEDSTGIWDPSNMQIVYEGNYEYDSDHFEASDSKPSNTKGNKENLSHEIGHIFGLDHPLDSLKPRAYFPDTIMNCCEGFTDTLLTDGDLGLLAYGWLQTFPHMYQNQDFATA